MEEVPEEFNSWFLLKVNFTEHLEIVDVGHRVRSNVLRMELEVGKYMIRLQRIYNFLLFHAIILPLLDIYGLYFGD